MSDTIDLVFWPDAGPSATDRPDLTGLGELLGEVCPDRLRLEATFDPGAGSLLRMSASFGTARSDVALLLRRGVVKLEGEAAFQAVPASAASNPRVSWTFLHPRVENAFLPSGNRIAFTLPLAGMAAMIFEGARRLEIKLAYSVQMLRIGPYPDYVRPLVAALGEAELGIPAVRRLEPGLRRILDLARRPGWYALEAFGVSATDHQAQLWLKSTLCDHLVAQSPGLSSELVDLEWSSTSPEPADPDFDGFVNGLRASNYLCDLVAAVSQPGSRAQAPRRLRSGGKRFGDGPYAFISYAHQDSVFARSVIEMLTELGVNYWYDSGIEPGDIWDETLEHRLEGASAVVLCLSEAYQASRYCRRELKFADVLSKPIIPLALQQTSWQPGLRLMFQELQIQLLDGSAKAVKDRLARVAPKVFLGLGS